jgi:hypothetical protein
MQEEQKTKESKRIGWGVKIPILSLEDIIEITKVTYNKAGSTNSIDALSRITSNSSSSSTFNKKVSALRNFGVFNIDKSSYVLTDLGKRIAEPQSFEQQAEAIIETFLNQENLKKIWEHFKGKKLPQEEFIGNTVVSLLNIPTQLKNDWVQYFVEAGKYAGLLDERLPGSYQVLSGYTPEANSNNIESITRITEQPAVDKTTSNNIREDTYQNETFNILNMSWGLLNVKSLSDKRKAIFAIPENLTQQDIDALKIVIKGIDVQLDGLKRTAELNNEE